MIEINNHFLSTNEMFENQFKFSLQKKQQQQTVVDAKKQITDQFDSLRTINACVTVYLGVGIARNMKLHSPIVHKMINLDLGSLHSADTTQEKFGFEENLIIYSKLFFCSLYTNCEYSAAQ